MIGYVKLDNLILRREVASPGRSHCLLGNRGIKLSCSQSLRGNGVFCQPRSRRDRQCGEREETS